MCIFFKLYTYTLSNVQVKGLDGRVRLFNRFRIFRGPRDIVLFNFLQIRQEPRLPRDILYDSTSAKPLSNFFQGFFSNLHVLY